MKSHGDDGKRCIEKSPEGPARECGTKNEPSMRL